MHVVISDLFSYANAILLSQRAHNSVEDANIRAHELVATLHISEPLLDFCVDYVLPHWFAMWSTHLTCHPFDVLSSFVTESCYEFEGH